MKRKCLLLPLLMVSCLMVRAQVFNVTPYSTEDGLIQSQVRAMIQDRQGYLWMGTHRGVSRFDSRSFSAFAPVRGSLPGNFLTSFLQDREGNLWMGTDKGLARFDGRDLKSFSSAGQLGDISILSLALDQRGHIWIGTSSSGITVYDGQKFSPSALEWEQTNRVAVNAIAAGEGDTMWIAAATGLFFSQGGRVKKYHNGHPGLNKEILSLFTDHNGKLWAGTNEGLLARTGSSWTLYSEKDGLPNRTIYCMVEDNDHTLWVGTGRGVARWKGNRFVPLVEKNRLLDYKIRSACVDAEGNLWFGTDGGGIRKVTQGIFSRYDMGTGLSSNLAKSFVEDLQGRLWVSTYDQGVSVLEGDRVMGYFNEENGLGDKDISYSYRDREGALWFCSYGGGITRYNGRFQVFNQQNGLMSNAVYCVEQVADNIWLIGGQNGVSVFDGRRFVRTIGPANGLLGEVVYKIFKDSGGQIWFGTNAGLSRLPKAPSATGELEWTNFPAPQKVGANIISMLEDPAGRMWFGSNTGVYMYQQDRFFPIILSNAPGASAIVSLVLDADTLLWIGTENGIYRIHPMQFQPGRPVKSDHFTQKDGLPSLECNGNAAYLDRQGDIWFGTSEGAIRRPRGAERPDAVPPPRLHITGVRPAQEVTWEELGVETDLTTGLPLKLELPHSQNRLGFDFIAISYKSPQQVEYRFKLEGLDQSFSLPTHETSVSYSNLRAGKYTFVVEARNETQPWEIAPSASFSFEIKPPYYATWWFILLAITLAGSVGWAIFLTVTRERRRQTEEKHLRERAEKLQLEQQALYAMMNPHFTFNALQSIQFFILRQDKIQANKFLSSFAKLVRKNLESTQSEFIPLAEEVERLELYLSLEKMRFQEKFEYQIQVDEGLDAHHTLMLPMILQPFVENSIRHGIMPKLTGGEIVVSLTKLDDTYLECRIRDNGIGIEASRKMKENRPNDHVSRGMQITLDRLSLFARMTGRNYKVDITELKNPDGTVSGTEVVMVMPLHFQP